MGMSESEVRRCYGRIVDDGVLNRPNGEVWRRLELFGGDFGRGEFGSRVVIRDGVVVGIGYDRRPPEGVLAR